MPFGLMRISTELFMLMTIIESAAAAAAIFCRLISCMWVLPATAWDVGQSHYSRGAKRNKEITKSNSNLMKSQNSDDNFAIFSAVCFIIFPSGDVCRTILSFRKLRWEEKCQPRFRNKTLDCLINCGKVKLFCV